MSAPIAVTIAGLDPSGGAGVAADLKTFSALGVYGAAIVTALTAQNTKGVFGIHDVPADFIAAQINAVFTDLAVGAVKIGMLGSPAAIDVVAAALDRYRPRNVVLDPVMIASSGQRLLRGDALSRLRELIARVRAVLRRLQKSTSESEVLRAADIVLDRSGRTVTIGARAVDLTPSEFAILATLMAAPGQVFSRLDLLDRVSGEAYEGYERTIDVHIRNLRTKIEPDPKNPSYIETVYGMGYRFAAHKASGG